MAKTGHYILEVINGDKGLFIHHFRDIDEWQASIEDRVKGLAVDNLPKFSKQIPPEGSPYDWPCGRWLLEVQVKQPYAVQAVTKYGVKEVWE